MSVVLKGVQPSGLCTNGESAAGPERQLFEQGVNQPFRRLVQALIESRQRRQRIGAFL